MSNLLLPITTGILTFITFAFLLTVGIASGSKAKIKSSLVFLVLTIGCMVWLALAGGRKVYLKGRDALTAFYQPRTGEKIYAVLFDQPIANCSTIINLTDQIVPRLDCCIWIEFETCPAELRRIIALEKYTSTILRSRNIEDHLPGYSPRPEWWTPQKLNAPITLLRSYQEQNPNRDKVLIFDADSTHVFYCDMAD